MGFFSDLGKKTTETAGKISKETKLKLKVNDNKNKIKALYETIGQKVYEKNAKDNTMCSKEDLSTEFTQIETLLKENEDARLEILKLNNKRICSKCSAEIESNSQFCPKCGEKIEAETPAPAPQPEENTTPENTEPNTDETKSE